MSNINDPRDPTLETRVTFPKSWHKEDADMLSSSNMFLSGLIMITRNRFLAWPALIMGVTSFINQHPLRTKEGSSGFSGLMLAVFAVVASYLPMILVTAPKQTQVPLPTS